MNSPRRLTSKILITMPFWNGDRTQAFKLARYLADLQPNFCEAADILFVARWDAKHGPETLKRVARKFNTFTHTSRRREVGWPRGCNGVFFGGLEWFYHKKKAGQIPAYRAMLNLESDVVPLVKDWLPRMVATWDELNAKKPICMAGALIPGVDRRDHINGGCCFISGDLVFLEWLVLHAGHFQVQAGWDWVLANDFAARGWGDIPGVRSYWKTEHFEPDRWDREINQGVYMIHGLKDDSLLELSRKKLLG